MHRLRWLAILMGITILGITGFQGYWLKDNYTREKQNLDLKTSAAFHQTVLRLQSSKLNLERLSLEFDSMPRSVTTNVVVQSRRRPNAPDTIRVKKLPPITMMNLLQEKLRESGADSGNAKAVIISGKDGFIQKLAHDSTGGINSRTFDTRIERVGMNRDSFLRQIDRESTNSRGKKPTRVILTYDGERTRLPKDSGRGGIFIDNHEDFIGPADDIMTQRVPPDIKQKNTVFRFLANIDSVSIKDSVKVKELTEAYRVKLNEEKMSSLAFTVKRLDSSYANSRNPNDITIGFSEPIVYHLSLDNEMSYLLKKLTLPILFSLLLVGITIISFVLLYRNVVRQRRLAELKNQFISNITHELKTPIATVGVAIEALKNFNAIDDPARTREYLDISQNELQRLGLLVDKVLKLSMFEKKEIELKKEQFDCKELTEEVMNSMRLQFEKYHATVSLLTEGDNFVVDADKLHITSVIYNLLDNALKYSKDNPVIDVHLMAQPDTIELSVTDNGIGIEPVYKEKIFDKFFRVPTGEKHNVKGYGLGLSYVAEIIKRHHGNVQVKSEPGKGSTFIARFPYV